MTAGRSTASVEAADEPVVLRADRVMLAPVRLRVHPALAARGHTGLTGQQVALVQRTRVAPLLLERQGATAEEAAEQLGLTAGTVAAELASLRALGVVAESARGRWYLLDIGALALHPLRVAQPAPETPRLRLVTAPA